MVPSVTMHTCSIAAHTASHHGAGPTSTDLLLQVSTPKVHHMRERQARARRGAVPFTPTAPATYTQHEAASSGGPAFGRPASKSAISGQRLRCSQAKRPMSVLEQKDMYRTHTGQRLQAGPGGLCSGKAAGSRGKQQLFTRIIQSRDSQACLDHPCSVGPG